MSETYTVDEETAAQIRRFAIDPNYAGDVERTVGYLLAPDRVTTDRLIAAFDVPASGTKAVEFEREHPRGPGGRFRRKYDKVSDFMREVLPQAHVVGGAVRDRLFGLNPKDEDFVVPGMGHEEISARLRPHGGVEDLTVGGRHVGIRFRPDYPDAPPEGVEVVPPRAERSTGPGRHDFEIVADPTVSLAEDAKRRDFTINALYQPVDPVHGAIIVPLGKPGSGKGTLGERVASSLDMPHVNVGSILRDLPKDTELGRQVHPIIARGDLLPDNLVMRLVEDRLRQPDVQSGIVLDGYPRTVPQLEHLQEFAKREGKPAVFVELALPDSEARLRLLSRNQGRADDTPEVIDHRLRLYADETKPLLDRLRASGNLQSIAVAGGSIEDNTAKLEQKVQQAVAKTPSVQIIDPLGTGVEDARNRILRPTSDTSFYEDPLRMMRGLRFMSRLNLKPDQATFDQMRRYAPQIEHVSGERIGGGLDANGMGELSKMLMGDHPAEALRVARDTGLLEHLIPEYAQSIGFDQESKYHNLPLDEHIFRALQAAADNGASLEVRLALLLHDLGKPDSAWRSADGRLRYYANPDLGKADHAVLGARIARDTTRRLKYPVRMQKAVEYLVEHHMVTEHDKPTALQARKFLAKHGKHALDLLAHRRADMLGKEPPEDGTPEGEKAAQRLANLDLLEKLIREQEHMPTRISDLAINGNDLIDLGYQPGPGLGRALADLLRNVIGEPKLNNREWLLAQAARIRGSYVDTPPKGTVTGLKATVQVRPYMREGRPVSGYTRHITRDAAAAIFDDFRFKGFRIEVAETDSYETDEGPVVEVVADIHHTYEDGSEGKVGYLIRKFYPDEQMVEHDTLTINKTVRGAGFASALNRHAEAQYPDHGIRKINLFAAEIGTYAWARAGYRFKRGWRIERDHSMRLSTFPYDLESLSYTLPDLKPRDAVAADEALKEFIARDDLTEFDIANFGRDRPEWNFTEGGEKMWPGKWFLINAPGGWHGIKDLVPPGEKAAPDQSGGNQRLPTDQLQIVARVHDEWSREKEQTDDDPGWPDQPDGNLYFSEDDGYWERIDKALAGSKARGEVHVRPYVRAGRPVAGYTQIRELVGDLIRGPSKRGKRNGRKGLTRPRKGWREYALEQRKTPVLDQDALRKEFTNAMGWRQATWAEEARRGSYYKYETDGTLVRLQGEKIDDEQGIRHGYRVFFGDEDRGFVPLWYDSDGGREIRTLQEVYDEAVPKSEQPHQQLLDEWFGGPGRPGRYQTMSGDPGLEFEAQHERIMEVGARLDAELQARIGPYEKRARGLQKKLDALDRERKRLGKARDDRMNEVAAKIVRDRRMPTEWPLFDPYDIDAAEVKKRLKALHRAEIKRPSERTARDMDVLTDPVNRAVARAIREARGDPGVQALNDQWYEVFKERSELRVPTQNAKAEYVIERRAQAYDILGGIRPFGGDIEAAMTGDVRDMMERVAPRLPASWIEASNDHDNFLNIERSERRGHYAHNYVSTLEPNAKQSMIRVSNSGGKDVGVEPGEATALHEMVHRAESTVPGLKGAEWTFYASRVAPYRNAKWQELEKLRDLTGIEGYADNERTRSDDFVDLYSGKTYGDDMDSAYELLTMGVEDLLAGNHGIMVRDDEYRQWVLGMMALL